MQRPLVIGNWKMNTSLSDAVVLAGAVKREASEIDADIVLCPPYVWLVPIMEEISRGPKNLYLGAQNMWFAGHGPMTGEISPEMLKELVKFVIIGHSERRSHFNESDELINDKIHAALNHGITPVLCVGELKKPEMDRGRGRPANIELRSNIIHQLGTALEGVGRDLIEKVVITYEPVWAISKGTIESRNAADGGYVNEVVTKIRDFIAKKYGQASAEQIRILYGGSVGAESIREYVYQPGVDGVLVGGASLRAKEFIEICREASGRE